MMAEGEGAFVSLTGLAWVVLLQQCGAEIEVIREEAGVLHPRDGGGVHAVGPITVIQILDAKKHSSFSLFLPKLISCCTSARTIYNSLFFMEE